MCIVSVVSIHVFPHPQPCGSYMKDKHLQWKAAATGSGSDSLLVYWGDEPRSEDDALFLCVEEWQMDPIRYRFYLGNKATALDHGVFNWGPE